MSALSEYVRTHTARGDCMCGKCIDAPSTPDPGHGVDMTFFKVAPTTETADVDDFKRLTAEHRGEFGDCNPFDGAEHNYIQLGGWIGDQGLAMQYMALGKMLGVFNLLTPAVLGIDGDLAMQMAGRGYLAVQART